MKREVRVKLEFRDFLALLALVLVWTAMLLEANGRHVAEWLKAPIGGVLSVVLGFYFVDKVRRPGADAPTPAATAAPVPSPAPAE